MENISIQSQVFLSKILEKLNSGSYDSYLNPPFLTKDSLFKFIKIKSKLKEQSGGNPILTDIEIKECISENIEVSLSTINLFLKLGFLEEKEDSIVLTTKGKLAIHETRK